MQLCVHLHVHASVRILLCTCTHRHTLIVPGTGVGLSAQKGSDGRGYHFVFMPTHMFPAYPSYRWWAVIADRYVMTMTCYFRLMVTHVAHKGCAMHRANPVGLCPVSVSVGGHWLKSTFSVKLSLISFAATLHIIMRIPHLHRHCSPGITAVVS